MAYWFKINDNRHTFSHWPRCGGCWVEGFLSGLENVDCGKLTPPRGFDERHFPVDNATFGVYREPVEWYVSWWRFCRSRHWIHKHVKRETHKHPLRPLLSCWSNDFAEFITNVVEKEPGFLKRGREPYDSRCEFLISFDRLREDTWSLVQSLGYDGPKPHVPRMNQSTFERPMVTPELRTMIEESES